MLPTFIYPPHPSTTRSQSVHLSYDATRHRIAYTNGRSVFVRSADPENSQAVQFTGHVKSATVAAFAPSGNYVASGDESGMVRIWDTSLDPEKCASPAQKAEYQVLGGAVTDIAWDHESKRIIAVGSGMEKAGHAFLWDTGSSIGEISGHSGQINAVAIKPQRPLRAAAVSGNSMVFYTGVPFKFDRSVRGHHTSTVRTVRYSPDGKWLVSAGSDRTIVVYDGTTGEHVRTLESAHTGGIYGVAWFADSAHFVTASADGTVKEWTPDFEEVYTYRVADSPGVTDQQVGVVVTKSHIVSLSLSGAFNYFVRGEPVPSVVNGPQGQVTSVRVVDGGDKVTTVYTGDSFGKVFKRTLNTDGAKNPLLVCAHSNYVVDIAETPSGLASVGWDDTLRYWDGSTVALPAQPKRLVRVGDFGLVVYESSMEVYRGTEKVSETSFSASCTAVDAQKSHVVVAFASRTLQAYTVDANGKVAAVDVTYPQLREVPSLVRISPDGELVAVADNTGKYTVLRTADASPVTTRWAFHTSRVYDARWSPDSKFLLSGGLDRSLLVYSVDRPTKVVKYLLAHQEGVSGVDWVGEGRFVSVGLDGGLRTWTIEH